MDFETFLFYVYVVVGALVFVSNGYFAHILIRHQTLLQRYGIIIVQMIGNAATGAALVLAGVARLIMIHAGFETLTSKRMCMLTPWNLLFIWYNFFFQWSLTKASVL
ncbi:unnamed protein product [Gongylonema pulchrum]|uniref:7TM_GPCR_Srx domain-containing protein n=1 Tax=Gongylonema pulchrum TaxID=637853 RepID=A0A183CYW2_9BILA|nr:unnamed protein product [Gongylonema pulchrum]